MEGQRQYTEDVVGVQPPSLPRGFRPEGEEVLEDPLVDDDARNAHQHEDDPRPADEEERDETLARGEKVGVQRPVEIDEEPAAQGMGGDLPPRGVGKELGGPRQGALGGDAQHRIASVGVGKADHPAPGVGRRSLQVADRRLHLGASLRHRHRVHLGPGPVVELPPEHAERSREPDRKQQPAEDEPGPGVQPQHRQGEGFFHGRRLVRCLPIAPRKERAALGY